MSKELKILLVFDCPYHTPRGYDFAKEFSGPDWSTERDIYSALLEQGHKIRLLGLYDRIEVLLE